MCQDWMISEVDLRGGYSWTCAVAAVGSYRSCFGTVVEVFRPRGYAAVIN